MSPLLLLVRGVALLPLPLAHGIGKLLGWLFFLLPNPHRTIAARNLALCYPHLTRGQRLNLLRRTLEETGKTLMEVPLFWCGSKQRVLGLIKGIDGEEAVHAAMAAGKGVIIAAPHIGAWELAGPHLSVNYGITIMYRPPRYAGIEELMRGSRERLGAHLVPTDIGGIKLLMQALKQGQMIGILPDQDPRDSGGIFAPFCGIETNTMTLLPKLAGKSGAAVFFSFAQRLPWGRGFHLHFLPAADVADGDMAQAARAVNAAVEQCIALDPAQYQWSYKRFRTRPPGEKRFY